MEIKREIKCEKEKEGESEWEILRDGGRKKRGKREKQDEGMRKESRQVTTTKERNSYRILRFIKGKKGF